MGKSRGHGIPTAKAARHDGTAAGRKVVVLFTCIGRRVSLLRSFRKAAKELRLSASFCGTDIGKLSPAFQLCDEALVVSRTTQPEYVDQLLAIVRKRKVKLLVPTVDLDLRLLAENKTRFAESGCRVLVSDPDVIDTCQDKRRTFEFLTRHGFDSPKTMSVRAALAADRRGELAWPCFLKRWDGYAGLDNAVAHDRSELRFFARRIPNPMCQEFVEGKEYTCDVYVDFNGQVRCVVPRLRIEIRSGEVSKSRIVRDSRIMAQAGRVVELLKAGPGVITVQLFVTEDGRLRFNEVNPRFGGGAPLSIQAGADFPKWILQELTGKQPQIDPQGFEDGLMMLRYDDEVWVRDSELKGSVKFEV